MQCPRCGCGLGRNRPDSLRQALACQIAAAILFVVSASFPIVAMEIQGEHTVATLIGAGRALREQGMISVAILVFVTTVVSPVLQIASMLYILLPLHLGRIPPHLTLAFRLLAHLRQWGMVEVFVVGVLVSLVKLAGLARVVPGIALWSFALLVILLAAAAVVLEPEDIWKRVAQLREDEASRSGIAKAAT